MTAIRNKSYWNYNNLNPKDPVALNLFSQKDLVDAIEKAERRVKREKKQKEKVKLEIDPKSHAAWTGGKQKLMDKGRISKFNKKFENFKSKKKN